MSGAVGLVPVALLLALLLLAEQAQASRGLLPAGARRSLLHGDICTKGTYLDEAAKCHRCPTGTTTTSPAPSGREACDACRPGFGAGTPSGRIDLDAWLPCSVCPSGTYAPGDLPGGRNCRACPQAPGFSGRMVSRPGLSSPDGCLGEFASDAGDARNYVEWDYIDMVPGSAYVLQPLLKTSAQCQIACAGDDRCTYFSFWAQGPAGEADACFHRVGGGGAAAAVSADAIGNWDAPAASLVLFEAGAGRYVAYRREEGEAIGVTVANGIQEFDAARAACDATPACVGLTYDRRKWRLFRGERREGVVGKVKVAGSHLDAWLPSPTGDELPALR